MVVTNRETLVLRANCVAGAIRTARMGTNPVTTYIPAHASYQRLMSPGFRGGFSPRVHALPPDQCDRDERHTQRAGRSGSCLEVLVRRSRVSAPLAWGKCARIQRAAERTSLQTLHSQRAPRAFGLQDGGVTGFTAGKDKGIAALPESSLNTCTNAFPARRSADASPTSGM